MDQEEPTTPANGSSFSYVVERDFVRFTMGETVDVAIVEEACQRLLADPAYRAPMNLLIDDRANKVPSSPTEARKAAHAMARYKGRLGPRFAFLVTSPVQYGMIRIFGSVAQFHGLTVRPFREEADALAWLAEPAE